MELNHLSSGYEPDEIPFLYSAFTNWGTRIRTWTNGVKVRCPTIRRFPNNCLTIDTILFFLHFSRENKEKYQKKTKIRLQLLFLFTPPDKNSPKKYHFTFLLGKNIASCFLFHKKSAYWNPICWIVVLYRRKYHRLAMQTLSSSTLK